MELFSFLILLWFTELIGTISSIFVGAFVFGAVGMLLGRFTETVHQGMRE